jgi:hypothetical protein
MSVRCRAILVARAVAPDHERIAPFARPADMPAFAARPHDAGTNRIGSAVIKSQSPDRSPMRALEDFMARTRAASLKKPTEGATVEDLMELLAKMRAGDIAPEERDFARRCLAMYRSRYLAWGATIKVRTERQSG